MYVQTDTTLLANNSQHSRMLHVTSVCTLCCCYAKFETVQTFIYVQTDATTPKVVGQQCCVRLHYGELENGSRSAARLVGFVLLSSFAANHKAD